MKSLNHPNIGESSLFLSIIGCSSKRFATLIRVYELLAGKKYTYGKNVDDVLTVS